MNDFLNIAYLKKGNIIQQSAWNCLTSLKIFNKLQTFNPVLAGTIPIEINIESSDLDIICNYNDKQYFISELYHHFSKLNSFYLKDKGSSVIGSFYHESFRIEIYGEHKRVKLQNAYLHMLSEYKLLNLSKSKLKEDIINLKKQGIKTEEAFGMLLRLKEPYNELISLLHFNNIKLKKILGKYAL